MRKAMKIIAGTLLIIALLAGLAMSMAGPVKGGIRQRYSKAAVKAAEDAMTSGAGELSFKVPASDALSIDGEEGETDADLKKLLEDMRSLSGEYETLSLIGILEIPCINVKEPVWDSCSVNALRYGVGRYPGTACIGDPGLCNLFGHRQAGDIDTKLGSIQFLAGMPGEQVIVTTIDGVRHEYRIKDTVYVRDAGLMPYLDPRTFEEETLCVTACGWGEDPLTGDYYPKNTEFIVICKPG